MHIKNTGRRSIQMVYKNKNIRSYYSVIFWAFVVGAVLMSLTLLALFSGLISTIKTMKDVKPIDTVLQESGNRALNTVYFDITEAPVFLGAEKKSNYYLLTDGNKYRVAEIEDEEYEEIKSAVEASGSYHIVGMTHYIFKKNTRNEIVSEVEKLMGQNVITDCLDDERGIVCIEYMKMNFWNVFKSGWGLFGIIIGIIGFPIFYGSFNEIKASRKVISLSNITAKDIDEEANKDGSIWLNSLRIYITENMVLGIISDGNKHEGQVALRYNEIQRIYGYNNIDLPKHMKMSVNATPTPEPEAIRNSISNFLASNGFVETMNNSLTKGAYYKGLTNMTIQHIGTSKNVMEKFGDEDGEYVIEEITTKPEIQKLDMQLGELTDKKEVIKTLADYIECQFGVVIGSNDAGDEFPYFEDPGDDEDDKE